MAYGKPLALLLASSALLASRVTAALPPVVVLEYPTPTASFPTPISGVSATDLQAGANAEVVNNYPGAGFYGFGVPSNRASNFSEAVARNQYVSFNVSINSSSFSFNAISFMASVEATTVGAISVRTSPTTELGSTTNITYVAAGPYKTYNVSFGSTVTRTSSFEIWLYFYITPQSGAFIFFDNIQLLLIPGPPTPACRRECLKDARADFREDRKDCRDPSVEPGTDRKVCNLLAKSALYSAYADCWGDNLAC